VRCLLPALIACFCLLACSRNGGAQFCIGELARGVVVKLSDAESGAPIQGATLILTTKGSEEETMQQFASTPEAMYDGAIDHAGTFSLSISAAGYESQMRTAIVVRWLGCHLDTQFLEIALVPQPTLHDDPALLLIVFGSEGVEVHAAHLLTGATR